MKPLPFAPHATPAIIVPIFARTGGDASRQAIAASPHDGVDVLEWRIDPLVAADEDAVPTHGGESGGDSGSNTAREGGNAAPEADGDSAPETDGSWTADLMAAYDAFVRTRIPTLVTVRSEAEGGHCPVERYAEAVEAAIALRPAAVDIELRREESVCLLAAAKAAEVATVVSAHMWDGTPTGDDLDATFAEMVAAGADVAKIAVMPDTAGDVLALLGATWRASQEHDIPVIGIAMGSLGRVTRLCAGEFGSAATFATVGAGSAPGQMTAEQVDLVRSILLRG